MAETMRAAVNTQYGPPAVVDIRDVPQPHPQQDEVLVQIHATSVNRTDCGMRRPHPFFIRLMSGLLRPKRTVLGMEFAGVVRAVGAGVTTFEPGQRVFGMSPTEYGAHAEYIAVPADGPLAVIPTGTDFDEAVLCEGAWYAHSCLHGVDLEAGQQILVYGASGAIGTAAVQLAKAAGAEVTAVVGTPQLELAASLGADHVVDYTAADFTRIGNRFDCVFDAVGKTTYFRCRRLLKPDGVFATTDLGPFWQNPLLVLWFAITRSRRVRLPLPVPADASFIQFVKERVKAGDLRAVVDRTFPLHAIADAYRYVETGQKTGVVVIHPAPLEASDSPD